MLFNVDKTKQCANFRYVLPLTKRQTDKQIYNTKKSINTQSNFSSTQFNSVSCFCRYCFFIVPPFVFLFAFQDFTLLYSALLDYTLLHSICFVQLYLTILCFTLSALFSFTLLFFAYLCFTSFYSALFSFTLFSFTFLYSSSLIFS